MCRLRILKEIGKMDGKLGDYMLLSIAIVIGLVASFVYIDLQ